MSQQQRNDDAYDRQFNREADKYFAPEILYCQQCEVVLTEDEGDNDGQFCDKCQKERDDEMSQQRYEYEVMRELEQEQALMMMEHDAYQAEQEALEPHQRDGYMENMVCMNEDRLKALRENGL